VVLIECVIVAPPETFCKELPIVTKKKQQQKHLIISFRLYFKNVI